jgi:hypothetical protein
MHNYQAVSTYSDIAFKNGKKVKDVEIVKQNNNGIIRQFVRDNMATRRPRNVRFDNAVSKRNSPERLGLSFRRMPTPYFTRNRNKVKGLRKTYGKNPK